MIVICLLLQMGLLIFDGWLFTMLPERPWFIVPGHAFACLLFSLSFGCSLNPYFPRLKAVLLGGLLAFHIPVVGMGCLLLVAFLLLFKSLPPGDLLKEFEKYTTVSDMSITEKKSLPISAEYLQSAQKVEPFLDMLSTPNVHLKLTVLDAIVRRRNPRLYPLILAAVEDPQTEIQQFAIAKVQKLRDEYELKILKAVEALKVLPASMEAHYRLALSYCQYMESGLMDKSVENFFQAQFQKEYHKILSFPYSSTEEHIFSSLGQLSLRMKQWKKAEAAFGKAIELTPNNIEANVGFMKLFYERRMYKKTLEQIHRIRAVMASDKKAAPREQAFSRCWLSSGVEIDEKYQ